MISHSLFAPLAGFIEKKLGLYLTLILSSSLVELDAFLFMNQTSILFSALLIVFLGFSNGMGMAVPGRNLYFYFPKKSGFLGSILTSCFILLGIILSVIGEKIINPEKYTLPKGEQFYPLEISKNYLTFYKIILIINPITLLIALPLIKKYDPKQDSDSDLPLNQENNENENIENIRNTNEKKKDEYYLQNIKSVIKDKRIFRIIAIITLGSFVMGFSRNTFRVYGALTSVNGTVMQYSQLFTGFSSIFVGPLWGHIHDKYPYSKTMKIICGCCIIQALSFSIFIKSNTIYIICILLGSIIGNGFMSASNVHIIKVYGIKYSLEIGGIIGIFSGFFKVLDSLLSFIISKYYHTGEELQFIYRFIYIFGVIICGVAFALSFYEKDDKFLYPYEQRDNEYSTIINSDVNFEKEKNYKNNNVEIELELESNSSSQTMIK
jgi:MFS family permease